MRATPTVRTRLGGGLAAGAAVAAVLLGLAGCSSGSSGDNDSSASSVAGGGSQASGSEDDAGGTAALSARQPAAGGAQSQAQSQAKGVLADTSPQQAAVISTGDVELKSGNVAQALFDVRQVVDRYQGSVEKESTDTDQKGRPIRSRLVVRVPSAAFETAMKALGRSATLVSTSSNSRDVTTAVLDNDVRVQVEQRSISRISTLLDQAASIKDVIAIEGQLSERQADLASLEQQQRYLADQTSMSTITVSLERTSAAPHHEVSHHHTGFAAGLGAGWHALRGFTVGLLTVLGAALPWLVVALVLAVPGVPLWRRLRRRAAPVA